MLEPAERMHLAELLRPPPGMRLGAAVGTTYTLELDALLAVPAALAATEVSSTSVDHGDHVAIEPVALLESVRRYAGLVTVFCQAGRIYLPPRRRAVFAWLEDSIVECAAPLGGVFHPKTWTLRFDPEDDDGETAFRFVCLSRNLTFDSAWDTVVCLDSRPRGGEQKGDASGEPLARFLRGTASAGQVGAEITPGRREAVEELAVGVGGISFAKPDDVDGLTLWPMGVAGCDPPPGGASAARALVCAPFVSQGGLARFTSGSAEDVLISTSESLSRVPAASEVGFGERFLLSADADPAEHSDEESVRESLRGLHAKLFVLERGTRARLITGSPNATGAAFARNVEFAVELEGRIDALGIDTLMVSVPKELRLRDLLVPFDPEGAALSGDDQPPLEWQLEQLAAEWVAAEWVAEVSDGTDGYTLRVSTRAPLPQPSQPVTAGVWPITLPSAFVAALSPGERVDAHFSVSVSAITSFVAVRLTAEGEAGACERVFVVNAALVGAPLDRRDAILAELLLRSDKFVEYLLLLLADPTEGLGVGDGSAAWAGLVDAAADPSVAPPLLEILVRAASRAPESLDHVNGLVCALMRTPAGQEVLPPGFLDLWAAIWGEEFVGEVDVAN